jgi:hypothetical protein
MKQKEERNAQNTGSPCKCESHIGQLIDVYNFLKEGGYELPYNQFEAFYKNAEQMINKNEEIFMTAVSKVMSEKLKEDHFKKPVRKSWLKKCWEALFAE